MPQRMLNAYQWISGSYRAQLRSTAVVASVLPLSLPDLSKSEFKRENIRDQVQSQPLLGAPRKRQMGDCDLLQIYGIAQRKNGVLRSESAAKWQDVGTLILPG